MFLAPMRLQVAGTVTALTLLAQLVHAAPHCVPQPHCNGHSPEKVTCEGLSLVPGATSAPLMGACAEETCAAACAAVSDLSVSWGLLPELGERSLRGLRLEALAVRSCGLHALQRRALAQQPNLLFLQLTGNSLRTLHRDVFSGAPRLEHLLLDFNLLSDTVALRNLPAVQVLSVRGNALPTLGPGAFCCNHLRVLDVGDNEIDFVDGGAFSTAPNLEEVDMSDNAIASLPPELFANTSNLLELNLSRNKIHQLDFLRDIPSLRFLELSDNAMETLQDGGFSGVTGLFHLSLARNRLHSIQSAAFDGLQVLAALDLSHNAISVLPPSALAGAPHLQRLNVEGNRLMRLRFLAGARTLTHLLAADNSVMALDHCENDSEDEETSSTVGAGDLSLQELDLSRNPLRRVCAGALAAWPSLAVLRVHGSALDNGSAHALLAAARPHLTSVDLGGNALREAVGRDATHVREMALRGNAIAHLPADAFRNAHLNLDLAHNGLRSVHPLALAAVGEVVALNLSHNAIRHLDESIFQKVSYVWDFDLSYNAIDELNFLRNVSSLRQLNMSHNNVEIIKDEAFLCSSIPLLFNLDLSSNNISIIEEYAFQGLKNLWDLNLSNNSIEFLSKDTFVETTSMWDLNLSNNKLNDLDWLRAWTVRHLNLSGNSLVELPDEVFSLQNATLLTMLDLSRNRIQSLSPRAMEGMRHLAHLDFSGNALKIVPETAFESTPALRTLDLSENLLHVAPVLPLLPALRSYDVSRNSLSELPAAATAGAPNLIVLRAAGNRLRTLDASTCNLQLRFLQELDLSGNQIVSMDPDTLDGCPALYKLDLSRNRLVQPPVLRLPVLRTLTLSANTLLQLPDDAFVHAELPALAALDLSWNALRDLGPGTLRSLSQLRVLDLSNNHLEDLAEDTFAGNAVLRSLDLSDNRLKHLEAVRRLPELRLLNVSGNILQSLAPRGGGRARGGGGRMLPRLATLDVSRNALQQLRGRDLAGLTRLRELDASNNRLQRVPLAAMVSEARRLRQLRVRNNPLSREAAAAVARAVELLSTRTLPQPTTHFDGPHLV